jgi:2'-5' RNA ligase
MRYHIDMYYAVIQRPEIDISKIAEVCRKYNPTAGVVGPHVTLVFPVSADKISEDSITQDVANVAARTTPFVAHMALLELSWDQWLFLTPPAGEGREEYVTLHDALYAGELHPFLRTDIPFAPHITLGHFAADDSNYNSKDPQAVPLSSEKYEAARAEIEKLNLDFTYASSAIELIAVSDDFTESHSLARFALGAQPG